MLLQGFDELQVLLQVLGAEAGEVGSVVVLFEVGGASDAAAEEAAGEDAVGGEAGADLAEGGEDLGFDVSRDEGVFALEGGDRVDGLGFGDGGGADFGEADVSDPAGFHAVSDGADGLVEGDGRVGATGHVEVDVVGPELAEGLGEGVFDGDRAAVDADELAVGAAEGAELHLDEELVAGLARGLEGAGQEELVVPPAVEVSRVEEG